MVHNCKNPIEALDNRVLREEQASAYSYLIHATQTRTAFNIIPYFLQIHQVISMIEAPLQLLKWRDVVTSYREAWSASGECNTKPGMEEHVGTLFEKEPRDYRVSDQVCASIAGFLVGGNGRLKLSAGRRSNDILSATYGRTARKYVPGGFSEVMGIEAFNAGEHLKARRSERVGIPAGRS